MPEVAALDARVTKMEEAIAEGFAEIKQLLRDEISDLKAEQIADLRKANDRLADDVRRLWERLADIERRENQRIGGGRALGGITHFVSAIFGGLMTALATWLSSGKPPH